MGDLRKRTCEYLQIPVLVKDISSCIKTLSKTQQCLYRSHYEDVIKQGRYQLLSIIRQIKEQNCRKHSLVPKEDIERDIFMAEMESEFEETKIAHVRKEWTQQQITMARLQEYLYKKCRLLSLHSSYASTQGSALCAILAVLMQYPKLVEAYLSEPDKYLINFIKIADGCLFSFVKTYAYDVSLEDSTDYRYILALYTCIVHISNLPRGRQFLIKRKECQNMLSELVYIIPHIKHSTAKELKIILLKILHNLTNEADSLNFLRGCSEICSTLDNCISTEYDPETHKYALELLEHLTKEIPNQECLDKITNIINTQRLKELSGQMYRDVNNIPRKIFQNIRIAADKILAQEQAQAQGDVLRSKSAGSMCKCKSTKSLEIEKKRSAPSAGGINSKQKIHITQDDQKQVHVKVSQKMTPTRDIYRPSSAQSSSSYVSTTELSETTSCTPSRDTPQRKSRPVAQTFRSASSHKLVNLCTSPCRYLFPDSPCMCRPHYSREHPTNIPIRKICIPSCGGPCSMREKRPASPFENSISNSVSESKKTNSAFSGYIPSSGVRPSSDSRPSSNDTSCSCNRSSSGGRPSSNHRPSSSNRSFKIKCKISGSSSTSTNKKNLSLSQKGSCVPSCTTAPSTDRSSSPSGTRSGNKPSFAVKPSDNKKSKIPIKVSCVSSCKNKDKSAIPVFGKSSNNRPSSNEKPSFSNNKPSSTNTPSSSNRLSSNNKPCPDNKKTPCPCIKTSKNKKVVKSPGKNSRVCGSSCKGSCKYKKRKVSSSSLKNSPKPSTNHCSCVTSKPKPASPDARSNRPSSSESKLKTNPLKSTTKQTTSEIEYKKPKDLTCTDKPSSPDIKNAVSFSKSIKASSKQPSSCLKETKSSDSKEEVKAVTCMPACTSSLGNANTASPVNSSPSVNNTDLEKAICTCGSISERRLVPWTSENRMVARLGEMDRRVFHHAQNTIRIVSKLEHHGTCRTQRVVTRIKIPGLRFQRVVDSQKKKE